MKVDGKPYRTIWLGADGTTVQAIDQTLLPHQFVVRDLPTMEDAERAIRTMIVRGAPLIGAAAAYGVALAMAADPSDASLKRAYDALLATRPTAVNLRWALDDLRALLAPLPQARRRDAAYKRAAEICDEDVEICRRIGEHGLGEIRRLKPRGERDQRAHPLQRRLARHRRLGHRAGADLPGAQCRHPDPCLGRRDAAAQPGRQPDRLGARQARRAAHRDRRQCRRPPDAARPGRLLHRRHRPHDAARRRLQQDRHLPEGAGRARQRRAVLCRPALSRRSTGRSRTARDIPIEERHAHEVSRIAGRTASGEVVTVDVLPEGSPAANPAFDVTPARLVTALITERGVCTASEAGLLSLYPEQAKAA